MCLELSNTQNCRSILLWCIVSTVENVRNDVGFRCILAFEAFELFAHNLECLIELIGTYFYMNLKWLQLNCFVRCNFVEQHNCLYVAFQQTILLASTLSKKSFVMSIRRRICDHSVNMNIPIV